MRGSVDGRVWRGLNFCAVVAAAAWMGGPMGLAVANTTMTEPVKRAVDQPNKAKPVEAKPNEAKPAEQTKESESMPEPTTEQQAERESGMKSGSALSGEVDRLDGSRQDLAEYRGKVVLIVNVASQCGLTPQYEGLQKLYESKAGAGLVVLGFPANNFMGQEPGTSQEIAAFCSQKYGVTFPMFAKMNVIDPDGRGSGEASPLFKRLTVFAAAMLSQAERAEMEAKPSRVEGVVPGSPSWNFTKYVIGRDGRLEARFDPQTKPDDAALVATLDRLLAEPAPAKK